MGIQPLLISSLAPSPTRDSERILTWKIVGFCERIVAGILLLLALPLLVFAGVAILLLSGAHPLIAHGRIGLAGKPFWILKLRTMWGREAPRCRTGRFAIERVGDHGVPAQKCGRDPRVTSRFAAFCRKYSIDEAPQLWHVVRGEMALIGPRPLTVAELIEHYGASADEVLRLKPGLTGLWQVRGRNRLTYRQRLRLDLFMARRWSPGLYLSILLATIPKVLSGEDAG